MSEKNEELDAAEDMSGKETEQAETAVEAEQADENEPAEEPEEPKEPKETKAPKSEPDKSESANHLDAPEQASRGISAPICVLIAVVALAIGVALGHFLMGGAGSSISLNGRSTLSESELNSTIATYTFEGATHNITARDVLTFGGAEPTANEDGTYDIPNTSSIVAYAQTKLMLDDAAKRGIDVTDEDVDEYLTTYYGMDLATYASSTGVTEDAAREMLRMYVTISELGESVAGGSLPEAPAEPAAPEDGAEETPTAAYAEYIIGLVGDEWDADANTWARSDGDYYATLSSYEITNDSATYAAASAAYSVAYTKYQEAYNAAAEKQNAYTTDLFSRASIQVGTLLS